MIDRTKQKFVRGDKVKVVDSLPGFMGHFGHEGETGIVVGSYEDQFPLMSSMENRFNEFTLKFETTGTKSSWWGDEQLILVAERNLETLDWLDGIKQLP